MPAYNFQTRFAPLVVSGQKRCTIRGRAAQPGQTAHLFTGMRTKACQRLGKGCITACTPIEIGNHNGSAKCKLRGRFLPYKAFDNLAKQDGFTGAAEMAAWFALTYGQKTRSMLEWTPYFSGYLIEWEPS